MKSTELETFLSEIYGYDEFQDYCTNGLVVEGEVRVQKILLAVSFSQQLVQTAIKEKADAIIVHHGIFNKGFFVLKGFHKTRIKTLMDHNISLFGIHLPMDAHPEIGHNICLLNYIKCTNIQPFATGFTGDNSMNLNLEQILETYFQKLEIPGRFIRTAGESPFTISWYNGITALENGPVVPKKITIISGASADYYEAAVTAGTDTFISGEIKEHIPAISFETKTNYLNLGHYYSEKPGLLALKEKLMDEFEVSVKFADIPNPI